VLIGDAAHTTHFTLGSGTRLAMIDAVMLAQSLYEHRRRDDQRCHRPTQGHPRTAAPAGGQIKAKLPVPFEGVEESPARWSGESRRRFRSISNPE
jgi:flavin-dependent dehydrogenase